MVIFLTLVRILFATLLLFVIWTMRREMAAAIDLGDDHQRLSHAVRELGPYLATVYVLAILLVGIVEIVQAGGLTPGAVTREPACSSSWRRSWTWRSAAS